MWRIRSPTGQSLGLCGDVTILDQSQPSGLLDGGAVEAAAGDGPQDVIQVCDVSQDGCDVQVDGGQPAAHCVLLLLHVPEAWPQMSLHVTLSVGQRRLQLLQATFIHRPRLV